MKKVFHRQDSNSDLARVRQQCSPLSYLGDMRVTNDDILYLLNLIRISSRNHQILLLAKMLRLLASCLATANLECSAPCMR